ncbi:MAG: alpha/beta fold hydrolase [Candidatus Melainabacteria bacterium]|nr:alpha/beta fold hydrolase [Candidatus Melainabacteria bacterium]
MSAVVVASTFMPMVVAAQPAPAEFAYGVSKTDWPLDVLGGTTVGNAGSVTDEGKRKDSTDRQPSTKKKTIRGDAPCLSWVEPQVIPRAVILCVHGLGLHSGSYEQFGKKMASLGFPTYAIDVRGFGSWMKAKGHQKVNFDACLNDVKTTLQAVRKANPGLSVFLLGESMGGAIALQATALNGELVDGLISAVPAADRFQQKKTDLKVALHLLTGFNRPFDVGTQVIKQATKDPMLRAEWKDDPLDRLKLSARELIQFQRFMNQNHDHAKEIKNTPVLIVQGSKDKLVKPEGTIELFEELATADKQLELVSNAEHLIFEEGQFSDETLDVVVAWIQKHAPEVASLTQEAARPYILQARQSLSNGQYGQAIVALENAVSVSPSCGEAHLLLGVAHLQLRHFFKAREHLRKAVRVSRGSIQAKKANQVLMSLPPRLLAPRMGPGTRPLASGLQRLRQSMPPGPLAGLLRPPALMMPGSRLASASNPNGSTLSMGSPAASGRRRKVRKKVIEADGQPTVLVFNATWCEPCQDMGSVIRDAKDRFGDRVQFIEIDVDDPGNEQLIEQYSISPVPTIVFLKPDGEVSSYAVGYAGIDGMVKGMSKILLD